MLRSVHRKSLIYEPIMASKLHLITYGCQMNEYDSERVAGLLRERQYELTDHAREAGCYGQPTVRQRVFRKTAWPSST